MALQTGRRKGTFTAVSSCLPVICGSVLVRAGKTLPKFSLEVMGACRRRHKKLTTSTFQRSHHISYQLHIGAVIFSHFSPRQNFSFSACRIEKFLCPLQMRVGCRISWRTLRLLLCTCSSYVRLSPPLCVYSAIVLIFSFLLSHRKGETLPSGTSRSVQDAPTLTACSCARSGGYSFLSPRSSSRSQQVFSSFR